MPKYDVNYVCEINFHIEAEDEEAAIAEGYDLLNGHSVQELYFDCNECYEMDEDDS